MPGLLRMNKRITVLHLIETLAKGGAERLLVSTLKHIDRDRFNPMVACLFDMLDFQKDLENLGIPVFRLSMKNRFDWRRGICKLAKIIKKNKVDIVHTHLFHANIYGRIASLFSPAKTIVTTLHNKDYTYEDNGRLSFKLRKYIDGYTGRCLNSKFIAVSNAVKEDFEKHLGFKDITVIYNGVDPEDFSIRGDSTKVRQEFGLTLKDFVLVNIGRMHPQKGQIYLIEALAIARRISEDIKLIIVGEGPLEEGLKKRAEELGLANSVLFIGRRNDIPGIIHMSDLLMCSSVYEGISIVVLEAMICAKPIIATDIDGMNEIITHGKEGIIVKPRNAKQLAEAIIYLMKDCNLKNRLGDNAKIRALRDFNISKNVKLFEDTYSELVGNKSLSACLVCGLRFHSNTVFGGYLYENKKYHIVKCENCGFMFLSPLPRQETLNKIYNGNDYFESYYATPTGIKGYIEGMADYNIYDEKAINLIKKYKKSGRLLDVGCAGGHFLINAKKSGYTVFGVEPNEKMAKYARDTLGFDVACKNLEDVTFDHNYFDVIHAGDILEHLLELPKSVEIIKGLLADDGILAIEQPLMYNNSIFNLFLRMNMLVKKSKYSASPPTHLWEFNATTLKKFLRKMGFEIVYYRISESRAKPLTAYEVPSTKNKVAFYIKNFSSFISNHVAKESGLGDRAFVVCKKTNGAK